MKIDWRGMRGLPVAWSKGHCDWHRSPSAKHRVLRQTEGHSSKAGKKNYIKAGFLRFQFVFS